MSTAVHFSSGIAGIINQFDRSILLFFSPLANHSGYFYEFVGFINSFPLIANGLFVSLLWWFWFRPVDDQQTQEVRGKVISALSAAIVVSFLFYFLGHVLLFRARPFMDATLGFPLKYSNEPVAKGSFPSGHALLFFCLAMSIWFISKRLGWVLFGYVIAIICLPKVHLGLHNPTDILAGAIVGIGVAYRSEHQVGA